jgi:hypothetical protein
VLKCRRIRQVGHVLMHAAHRRHELITHGIRRRGRRYSGSQSVAAEKHEEPCQAPSRTYPHERILDGAGRGVARLFAPIALQAIRRTPVRFVSVALPLLAQVRAEAHAGRMRGPTVLHPRRQS